MEASSAGNRGGRRSMRDVLSTREGSIAVAVATALLAGLLLLVFVQRYRDNANSSTVSTSVFVARSLIPRGSSADIIASQQLLQRTNLRGSQVRSGAISDPTVLHGQVAVADIYPGQQITLADFTAAAPGVGSRLTGTDRAVAVPVDSAHGLVGQVQAGDYVDVLAGLGGGAAGPSIRTLLQNVQVLGAPGGGGGGGIGGGGGGGGNIILKVSDQAAARLAFAADNGKVWIVLRPPAGAKQSPPASVTAASVSAGGR